MLKEIAVRTSRRMEFIDITAAVDEALAEYGADSGICTVFVPHTTAAVTINENADPDVVSDMLDHMEKLVPEEAGFSHSEGNSDAHIKSSLFSPSLTAIVENGHLKLGTWQGVYFAEFDGPRQRKVWVKYIKG